MKKFYSKMAAALTASSAVVCMCSAFPASAAETVRLTGDLDGDLHVTALDAQMTLDLYAQALVGNADNTATEENSNVDIDMDGEIDVLDAQYILLYYCQTLVGDQPLWADFRDVSYHDGAELTVIDRYENGEAVRVPANVKFNKKGLYVEIGCAQGAPGETVTVPVYVAGGDLIAFGMFVDTPEGLEANDITTGLEEEFNLWCPKTEEQKQEEWGKVDGQYAHYGFNPLKGSFGFTTIENLHTSDGCILAYYSYTIPEDAQPGTAYPICLNTAKSEFLAKVGLGVIGELGDELWETQSYQYTLLNGVVVVE